MWGTGSWRTAGENTYFGADLADSSSGGGGWGPWPQIDPYTFDFSALDTEEKRRKWLNSEDTWTPVWGTEETGVNYSS